MDQAIQYQYIKMNGKGSKYRPVDKRTWDTRYEKLDWTNDKPKEPDVTTTAPERDQCENAESGNDRTDRAS